jgi:hypothetical protein
VVEFQKNAGRVPQKMPLKNGGKACTMYHDLILVKALCAYHLELAGTITARVLVDSLFYRGSTVAQLRQPAFNKLLLYASSGKSFDRLQ